MKQFKIIEGEGDNEQYRFKIGFNKIGDQESYFSIVGETWDLGRPKVDRYSRCCGALQVGGYVPELAYLDKYHLVSIKEPMHYIANSLYHASDRDHYGLLKGETRQIINGKTGIPCWILQAVDGLGNVVDLYRIEKYQDARERPPQTDLKLEWVPLLRIGEGKEPNLEAARTSACWPDAELSDFTRENLEARLPELMEQFKKDITDFGLDWPAN